MSSYTSEIVIGTAIVAALGVAAYLVIQPAPAHPDENQLSTTQKKQPKKKKPTLQDSLREKPLPPPPAPRIPKPAATVPGGFAPLDNDELSAASGSNAGSAKRKKKKPVKKATGNSATVNPLGGSIQPGTAAAASTQRHLPHLSPEYSVQESRTDESPWTRVESRRKPSNGAPESTSDAGVTTSVTEEEGSVTEKKEGPVEEKLTLAEKLLPPPPETAVDDMLEGLKPGIARVLRVTQNYDRPSGTADWGDYEDAEDVRGADPDTDDGWSVVPEKAKRSAQAGGSGYASAASITVAAGSGSESQSKNAKKNAKKKEAVKAVKAANEVARQAALAKHKREQEAARIAEQFKTKSKQSGTMSASVNDKGQLVWE